MDCKLCHQPYQLQDSNKLPRVLTQCGHTFCNECISLHMARFQSFVCKQCDKVNTPLQDGNFPLNQTLISILQNRQNGLCQFIKVKESEICKKHGKKLEAYCENDKTLLCLTCILTQHKSHKIVSISEVHLNQTKKVSKQKQSLRNCEGEIAKSNDFLVRKQQQCRNMVDRLNLDFNEYVFEINMMYKSVINQLKQSEEKYIATTRKTIEREIKEVQKVQVMVREKISFYHELMNIFKELNLKSGVQFIQEANKQAFISENCLIKQSFAIAYKKQQIDKEKILNETIKSLQQFILFEKKKAILQTDKKHPLNKNQTQNPNHLQSKYEQKALKAIGKEESTSRLINESPCRVQKKSISSVQKGKEPQILEVNLVQKYEKHLKTKNMKKRNSQILVSKGKSPKIQYQVKREIDAAQKLPQKHSFHYENGPGESSARKIKLVTCELGSSAKKLSQSEKSLTHSNFHSKKTDDFASLSFFNQSLIITSPQRFKNSNHTFDAETPLSINSFMESSQCTVFQQRKDQTIFKNSTTSFTLFCTEEKVFHFGGLKNNSISSQQISNNISSVTLSDLKITAGLSRSKAQCVILKSFHPRKCLILGGKDGNGERSREICAYDFEGKKVQKCGLELNEAMSGFGAVAYNEKLYVFGGSSFSALKNLHEYKLGRSGFEIKKLSSMINSRDELGFALGFDEYLYVGGGINSSNVILNSCQRYCFKTNKWYSIAAMKTPRRSFTLISLPNALYAIGGHDGKSYLKSVEMYDFEFQTWVQVSAMNEGRFTHSAVSTSDYQNIIVFGGFQNQPLRSVEVYNTVENKWTVINQMEEERYLHCSILIQE